MRKFKTASQMNGKSAKNETKRNHFTFHLIYQHSHFKTKNNDYNFSHSFVDRCVGLVFAWHACRNGVSMVVFCWKPHKIKTISHYFLVFFLLLFCFALFRYSSHKYSFNSHLTLSLIFCHARTHIELVMQQSLTSLFFGFFLCYLFIKRKQLTLFAIWC